MKFGESPILSQEEMMKIESEKEIPTEIFQEIKEEITKGECGHYVRTKINVGEIFKGCQGREGQDFQGFLDAPNMPEEVKKQLSKEVIIPINFLRLDEYGNASIFIGPYKDNISRLILEYQNDPSKFNDSRAGSTTISFFVREKLANRILDEIEKNPNNFWNFINGTEPELLKVAPPRKESYYTKISGLSVFKQKEGEKIDGYRMEPTKILKWRTEVKIEKNETTKDQEKEIPGKQKKEEKLEVNVKKLPDEKDNEKRVKEVMNELTKSQEKAMTLEEFIKKHLHGLLQGAELVGKIHYSPPSSRQYNIEEKGLLWSKKFVVKNWEKDIIEFKSRGEAEEFIKKEREKRIREDLAEIWEKNK